jgi:hypothetical protein
MENNDSPYIYEKPLRAKGSRVTKSIAALGLVAVGTVIGGNAFANSPISHAVSPQLEDSTADSADSPVIVNASGSRFASADEASASILFEQSAPIVALPLEQAAPKKNSASLELPQINADSYGNTSSATPSAGGGQTGSNTSSYKTYADSDDDRDDHGYEDDERDDDDDENEED